MVRLGEPSSGTWETLRFRLILSFFVLAEQSMASDKGESSPMWNSVEVSCFSGVIGIENVVLVVCKDDRLFAA